jgi:pSer/pThr/pTyr-binding forkhead associated (FHA) protein
LATLRTILVSDKEDITTLPQETTAIPVIESDPGPDTSEVPMLEPGIYLVGSDGKGTVTIQITEGTVRLGRGFAADIQIDDPTLSRRHAIIVHEDGVTTVLDDRSANGTFINGKQVVRQQLVHGDKVSFGRIVMRYIIQGAK